MTKINNINYKNIADQQNVKITYKIIYIRFA